jgi:hypothetical protein
MADIPNYAFFVEGIKAQTDKANVGNNPPGLRIASLRRRRVKGFDDLPGKGRPPHGPAQPPGPPGGRPPGRP